MRQNPLHFFCLIGNFRKRRMKNKFLIILTFVFPLLNFAQSHLLGEGNISQKSYNEVILFQIERGNIIIPVTIDNKKYRFLFDTGASNTLNADKFVNVKNIGSLKTSDSNSKEESLMISKVQNFKLGNLLFENFNFLKYQFSKNFIFNCLNLDGIIGSNSFKNSIIKIDYQQKKLFITNDLKNLTPKVKAQKMKLMGYQKLPFIELTLVGKDKVKEDVLFDTGYSKLYTQSNRAFNIFSKKSVLNRIITKDAKLSIGLFGSDQESSKSVFTIPIFIFGDYSLKNVVAYSSSDDNSKIGNEILNFGSVTLDFVKSKYYFEKLNNNQNTDLLKEYPLFVPSYENGNLIIGMVISENLNSVLKVGDKITKIDEHKIDHLNCTDIMNFQYPKETLEINNNGIEISLKNYR